MCDGTVYRQYSVCLSSADTPLSVFIRRAFLLGAAVQSSVMVQSCVCVQKNTKWNTHSLLFLHKNKKRHVSEGKKCERFRGWDSNSCMNSASCWAGGIVSCQPQRTIRVTSVVSTLWYEYEMSWWSGLHSFGSMAPNTVQCATKDTRTRTWTRPSYMSQYDSSCTRTRKIRILNEGLSCSWFKRNVCKNRVLQWATLPCSIRGSIKSKWQSSCLEHSHRRTSLGAILQGTCSSVTNCWSW